MEQSTGRQLLGRVARPSTIGTSAVGIESTNFPMPRDVFSLVSDPMQLGVVGHRVGAGQQQQ